MAAVPLFVLLPDNELTIAHQASVVAEAPAPEEILLLEELEAWSGGSDEGRLIPFPEHPRLSDAFQKRRQSFDVFSATEHSHTTLVGGFPFGAEILAAANRHELDPLLVASVVEAESSFDPFAVSAVGAVGLMQLMPTTAAELGAHDSTDPGTNLDAGSRYLAHLLSRFDGNLALALAAYNAGPGNVERFGAIPPFRETRRYVERVLGRYLEHRQIAWQLETAPGASSEPVAAAF